MPYLVDKLGDEPMHLTAATGKLASVYEQHGFRAEGKGPWPFRNYQIRMIRPGAAVANRDDLSADP